MRCLKCSCLEDKVIDSRSSKEGSTIRRRRECLGCGHRFTTYEEIQHEGIMVIKRDGRRESYSKEKLLSSLRKACQKLPISPDEIEELSARITAEVGEQYGTEVPYKDIGEYVMNGLRKLDKVAYVRYASIYRRFEEITDFVQEVKKLEERKDDSATLQLPGI